MEMFPGNPEGMPPNGAGDSDLWAEIQRGIMEYLRKKFPKLVPTEEKIQLKEVEPGLGVDEQPLMGSRLMDGDERLRRERRQRQSRLYT